MINALLVLLGCQLAGEAAARILASPVPGPVIGAALLAAGLLLRGGVPGFLSTTANGILRNLSLLFVPAAVGLMQHVDLVARHGAALLATLVLSALLTMVATAWVFTLTSRLVGRGPEDAGE